MAAPLTMTCSRTFPIEVERAFDAFLPLPLPKLFNRRYGPIPAVRRTDGPATPWGTAGQVRTVHLVGGGSTREELTSVDRPRAFDYALTQVRGPMRALAARVDGTWLFEPVGTGTRITWRWTVHPASGLAAPMLPAFAKIWRGYAARALQRVEELLVA